MPFASLAYAEAVRQTLGRKYRIAVVEHSDAITAGILLYERRFGPYRIAAPPPYTAYTPILLRSPQRDSDVHYRRTAVDRLIEFLEERFHRLSLLLHPSFQDVRPYSWQNWQVRPLYTYHLSLTENPSEFLQNWSSSRRYDFRKAKEIFRVRELNNTVDTIVDLCARSYARSDRSLPGGRENVVRLVRKLLDFETARAFTAVSEDTDKPEAGVVLLRSGDTAYYWLAGSIPGRAMTVLVGTLCDRLREEGFATFDLVGANTPSIAEFKRQFGAQLVSYYHVSRLVRPELRIVDLFRNLRR